MAAKDLPPWILQTAQERTSPASIKPLLSSTSLSDVRQRS